MRIFAVAALAWTAIAAFQGVDEFGRSVVAVLYASIGLSVLRGALVGIPLIAGVFLLITASEVYSWRWVSVAGDFIFDAIESVPSYLWVLAAIAAASHMPVLASNIALAVGLSPLAYATLKGVMREVMGQPFIAGAVLSGLPRHVILLRHVVPHVVAPTAALAFNIVGAAVAIYGAIGAFGFANRQTLDLGTLLLRGRELAGIDTSLLWLTVAGYCLLFIALHGGSQLLYKRMAGSQM
jgi:peptide/nickel transport system permease protein